MKNKKIYILLAFICLMLSACGNELDVTDESGNRIQVDADSRVVYDFVKIGGRLYYDPNTMIVWLRNGENTLYESPIYVPYVGSDGLPLLYEGGDWASVSTWDFVEIGGSLYYDPNTMIIWMKNNAGSTYESPIYVPYIGPNGFPYRYDKETGSFMQTQERQLTVYK